MRWLCMLIVLAPIAAFLSIAPTKQVQTRGPTAAATVVGGSASLEPADMLRRLQPSGRFMEQVRTADGGVNRLETRRLANGTLQVYAETVMVEETGPFYISGVKQGVFHIGALAHCGTIATSTPKVYRFERILTRDEELKIDRIEFRKMSIEK